MGPVVQRFWTSGHRVEDIVRILSALPPRLDAALGGLLNSIHAAIRHSSSRVVTRPQSFSDSNHHPLGEHRNDRGGNAEEIIAMATGQVVEEEAVLWDEEGVGFLRLDFDPVSQRCLQVSTNNTFPWQFKMSREELLARFAVSDVALPYTDIDILRYFAVELATTQRDVHRFFGRFVQFDGSTNCASALLFSRTSLRVFDAQGKVTTAKHVIRIISPDEYDMAVQQDPSACPHVITGDHRSGRQLIADAALDFQVQLTGLATSSRSRMELNALAAFVETATSSLAVGICV